MLSAPLLAAGLLTVALLLAFVALIAACLHLRRPREAIGAADPEKGLAEAADESSKTSGGGEVVRRYGWKEIEAMTEGFSTAMIGEGGYSTVYLARLEDGTLGAVKVHQQAGESEAFHRAFEKELEVLLRVRHHHVVRLLGFARHREGGGGALVFEYVPNGTLHEKLHPAASSAPLTWSRRLSIAYQIACAVEHLHEQCDLPIIHGDMKPSNVLLDDRLDAKLCDFGSAKLGFSSAVRPAPVVGSPGYVDPHYLRTGVPSKKNDVYGFGVVLLEMVTGREAFREGSGGLLTSQDVRAALREEGRVGELVDARLCGEYARDEAAVVAALVRRCVGDGVRPTMGEVVKALAGMVREEEEVVGEEIGHVGPKNKGGGL